MNDHRKKPLILGIGGTLRDQSTGRQALAYVLAGIETLGGRTAIISGADLDLPLYLPDQLVRSAKTERMVALMRECEGVVICSPSYHGSVSGLIKNALDYTEDMNRDERVYFDGLAVGCIAYGAGWQAIGPTLAALRAISHALRGWPTPMGAMINSTNRNFDEAGACVNASVKTQLDVMARQVFDFILMRRSGIV